MVKRVVLVVLILATLAFATLTTMRLMMDYNENGIYFDGEVTYTTDAIPAYGLITTGLLLLTISLQVFWKKTPSAKELNS